MKHRRSQTAPGRPGRFAHWPSARKDQIGTAIAPESRIWFSTVRGALTEIFYPDPDRVAVRALRFLVTDAEGFFSDESTDAAADRFVASRFAPSVRVRATDPKGRYRLEKTIVPDPRGNALLVRVHFESMGTAALACRLYCQLEPYFGAETPDATALIDCYEGATALVATSSDGRALALVSSAPWGQTSAGFLGTSDGREDLVSTGALREEYESAEHGQVVLLGEIDGSGLERDFCLVLGFGRDPTDAIREARSSLARGFDAALGEFERQWLAWKPASGLETEGPAARLLGSSLVVLKTLEAKKKTGGRVAALSTPWGPTRGPGPDGTYHLVWTRDLVECAGAMLAAGLRDEVASAFDCLRTTQYADGHWPQNMRLSGEPFWNNNELDEVALPVLLLDLARREGVLDPKDCAALWPVTKAAAGFVAHRGPTTRRDRWEDTSGVSPFTVATSIAALVVGGRMAREQGEASIAAFLENLADEWNDSIESWLYRRGGPLAEAAGVDGYYVRARRPGEPFAQSFDPRRPPKTEVSPDALALVRFGVRAPDDPRMRDTVTVIDFLLKTEFDDGPSWRRYPGDEYGEYDTGSPFDGHGVGRSWPLFTGERAHYELAAGDTARARLLFRTLESFAGTTGMLPEQVWDGNDVPERGLVRGLATGSAAPLGWSHAEYVKLWRSLRDGAVFDTPVAVRERYADAFRRKG